MFNWLIIALIFSTPKPHFGQYVEELPHNFHQFDQTYLNRETNCFNHTTKIDFRSMARKFIIKKKSVPHHETLRAGDAGGTPLAETMEAGEFDQ